jgi:hypothetical protein
MTENLYESLRYNISTEDLTTDEKEELLKLINELDNDRKKQVFMLILHDYVKSNPNTKVIFPYKSKQISNDQVEIKLDALPIELKRVLYKFCKLAQISLSEQTPTPSV